jgi:hypothetical protein
VNGEESLAAELDLQGVRDRSRNLILHGKDIVPGAFVLVRPQQPAAMDVYQLRGDPQALARDADASLRYVLHFQTHSDFARILGPAFELKYRAACDDPQIFESRQRVDQLFGETIAEILVLARGSKVHEGQNRQRRLARLRGARGGRGLLEHRNIRAFRYLDPDCVMHALGLIVGFETRAKPVGVHPNDWVCLRVKGVRPPTNLTADRILLDGVLTACQRLFHNEAKEGAKSVGVLECTAGKDAIQLALHGLRLEPHKIKISCRAKGGRGFDGCGTSSEQL